MTDTALEESLDDVLEGIPGDPEPSDSDTPDSPNTEPDDSDGAGAKEDEDDTPVFDTTSNLAFKTKKFALQHLLDRAMNVVPSKDIVPVLKNFLIVASPGRLDVTATDLELAVLATSEMVMVQGAGSAVFPAKRLREIVTEAEDGELSVTVEAGEAKIEIGRTAYSLRLMSGEDYPPMPDISEVEFHDVDRLKFIAAIRSVKYAASTETSRPSLMLIDVSDGEMRASDGVRFQQVKVGKTIPIDIQIPINAVDDLVKILNTTEANTIEIGEDDVSLIFRIAGDVFIAQKLNAVFPDVDEVLLKPALANDQPLNVDRKDLIDAIKRVRITADEETSAISLHLDGDLLVVKSKDKYGSTGEEQVDVKWGGSLKEIAFNHVHLLQMLEMSDAKSCHFFLGEGTKTRPSPLLLRDDGAGLIGVLNQLRVDWLTTGQTAKADA